MIILTTIFSISLLTIPVLKRLPPKNGGVRKANLNSLGQIWKGFYQL